MTLRRWIAPSSIVPILVLALLAPSTSSAQPLQLAVQSILNDPGLRTSRTGVIVIDMESGTTLAEHRPDAELIPASNMKLLTSGVALTQLGSDFVFKTDLLVDESHRAPGGERGRVVLRGSGDPGLADPPLLRAMGMGAMGIVDAWVQALRGAGIDGPVGELVIDDRVFDREYVHPTWPVQQLNRWYCAEVAGVNFHANLLLIYTEPTSTGHAPTIRTEPEAPWIQIRNRARCVSQGNHTAWAARALLSNNMTLHGDVRWASDPVKISLHDNPGVVGRLLGDAMRQAGIAPATVRLANPDEQLNGGRTIHRITTDLQTVLHRCNVDSYNLYAECMLKRLGHELTHQPGSWTNGSALVRMVLLEKIGPTTTKALTVADGSGMSRENRVSPRLVAEWLIALLGEEEADVFLQSLPSANSGEGTLAKRFGSVPIRNEVRAKTGYLTGVSALSGYIMHPRTNRTVVFSIITNEKPNSVRLSLVRGMEERIVRLADKWLTEQESAAIGQVDE